jgi:hypothetical protein
MNALYMNTYDTVNIAVLVDRAVAASVEAHSCGKHLQVVVKADSSSAGGQYTDKPLPNAFWRAFSAFVYVVPAIDTWALGIRVYDVLAPTILLRKIASAFPFHTS